MRRRRPTRRAIPTAGAAARVGRSGGWYYTPKGEEWRIPAFRLIWEAAGKSGGWNEHFERLEGMLCGYEDWQNDWWINTALSRGGIGGAMLCCAVTTAGLDWIEAAGYRAPPPIDTPALAVTNYDAWNEAAMRDFTLRTRDAVALVVFNVPGRATIRFLDDLGEPPWQVPKEQISELNEQLRRSVVVAARRETG